MIYSYTQISQYLACPRRYRYKYLDGWKEKDDRPNLYFGRAFERALAACFLGNDSEQMFFEEWARFRNLPLKYSDRDSWDCMLYQGIHLLQRFCQEDRVRVSQPALNLQRKYVRRISGQVEFVAYVDAIAQLDGVLAVVDWKTTSARLSEEQQQVLALDPQLICYSWITGIAEVAMVFFVRKRSPEIQYVRATISPTQREEYGELVEQTIAQIEAARFVPRSGIRFPQNGCVHCAFVGLCLNRPEMVQADLIPDGRKNRDWIDRFSY